MTAFKDHFSGHAGSYRAHRPTYGADVAAWLATLAPASVTAWDVGTGSGQLATLLAEHVHHVIATDASAEQLAQAPSHRRVTYLHEPAEGTSIAPASIGLVTVAQAVHWFDLERFYAEVRRVTVPGAALVLLGYELMHITPEIDEVLGWFYRDVVGAHWPPERAHLEAGYRDLPFPFAPIPAHPLTMTHAWTRDEVLGYLGSWSATTRSARALGTDPLVPLLERLAPVWPDASVRRQVTWPLLVVAGRVP